MANITLLGALLNATDKCYLAGEYPPHYPVPARIVTFDYWPASHTDNGKPAVYGHDHYKPGRWLEFLEVN